MDFQFETANLAGEAKRKCELLQEPGFTVVRVAPLLTYFANSDVGSQHQLVQAAVNHLDEVYRSGRAIMTTYDEDFGRKVLAFVASHHPKRVQMMELKEAIKPEPTDEELLLALDALAIDCYIEGKSLRESTSGTAKLAVMANIVTTKAGREFLKPAALNAATGSISNLHFHGPVGAVGHHSTGTVTVNQQWVQSAPEPDWTAVAAAFQEAASLKAKDASSSDDYLVVASLARAQEEAKSGDKSAFLNTVTKIGQASLPILAKAGAEGLAAYLKHHLS